MPRQARAAPGGYVYHALNRAVARLLLFQKPADYDAFERVLVEALVKHRISLLAYCVMPNHCQFVHWPETDEQLTEFLRWLAHTHTQRWHAHYHTAGTGHLYQGRFKAFPVQEDEEGKEVTRNGPRPFVLHNPAHQNGHNLINGQGNQLPYGTIIIIRPGA